MYMHDAIKHTDPPAVCLIVQVHTQYAGEHVSSAVCITGACPHIKMYRSALEWMGDRVLERRSEQKRDREGHSFLLL